MSLKFLNDQDHLLSELLSPQDKFLFQNYHYQLEKIHFLKGEYGDLEFGKSQFVVLLPILNKYINISNEDYYELFILSRIGLYFYCLNNESMINELIPKSNYYRILEKSKKD